MVKQFLYKKKNQGKNINDYKERSISTKKKTILNFNGADLQEIIELKQK